MTPILYGVPVACFAGALYQALAEPVVPVAPVEPVVPPAALVGVLLELGAAVVADVVPLVEDFDDELQAPAIIATALMKLANRTVDFRPVGLITKTPSPLQAEARGM
jgi:hypothetical protein